MKHWKQGFYDEPQKGSVEIEDAYWLELLEGQSAGKLIKENELGYPILVEYQYTLEELKASKVSELQAYDKSDAVNQFFINDAPAWIDKDTRVGLMNSINVEKIAARTETRMWLGGIPYAIPCDTAIEMLRTIELYALECYNVTQIHITAVNSLSTKEEIEAYNFTIGYPEKPTFIN